MLSALQNETKDKPLLKGMAAIMDTADMQAAETQFRAMYIPVDLQAAQRMIKEQKLTRISMARAAKECFLRRLPIDILPSHGSSKGAPCVTHHTPRTTAPQHAASCSKRSRSALTSLCLQVGRTGRYSKS